MGMHTTITTAIYINTFYMHSQIQFGNEISVMHNSFPSSPMGMHTTITTAIYINTFHIHSQIKFGNEIWLCGPCFSDFAIIVREDAPFHLF